jgi:hypothetical protein
MMMILMICLVFLPLLEPTEFASVTPTTVPLTPFAVVVAAVVGKSMGSALFTSRSGCKMGKIVVK